MVWWQGAQPLDLWAVRQLVWQPDASAHMLRQPVPAAPPMALHQQCAACREGKYAFGVLLCTVMQVVIASKARAAVWQYRRLCVCAEPGTGTAAHAH